MPRKTHRGWTVFALLLGMFMSAMEMTVISTAMPTVIGDLGGIELYSWVFTAYMLAATVPVPLCGKLADLYGRRPVLMFGLIVFLVGSAASGQARSMPELIAFRALQGLGAAAVGPIALTVVGDIFTLHERSRMQGVFGAVWGFAGIIGPFLGGTIVHYVSWRWVFYINIPFGLASIAILLASFHENVVRSPHRLDFAGAGLLTVASLGLLAGSHGGIAALVAFPAAAVALAAFLFVETRAPEPVLPLKLFRQRLIAISSLVGAFIGATMMGILTFVPLFVQGVLGGSPTAAGASIAPMSVAWPLASAVSGRLLPKTGFRPLVWIGLAVLAASSAGLALILHPGVRLIHAQLVVAAVGLGLGFANTALLISVQTSVNWRQRGIATASTLFFRTIGGTLAVGVMGGVLAAALASQSAIPLDAVNAFLSPARGTSPSPDSLRALAPVFALPLTRIFWIIAALSAAALLASFAFPEPEAVASPPPDEKSGEIPAEAPSAAL